MFFNLLSIVLFHVTPFITLNRNSQTPESKKQEFRKYLERSGVIDALTKGKLNTSDPHCTHINFLASFLHFWHIRFFCSHITSSCGPLWGTRETSKRCWLHQEIHGCSNWYWYRYHHCRKWRVEEEIGWSEVNYHWDEFETSGKLTEPPTTA